MYLRKLELIRYRGSLLLYDCSARVCPFHIDELPERPNRSPNVWNAGKLLRVFAYQCHS